MRYAVLFAAATLISAWGQTVKPTPGALGNVTALPAAAPAPPPTAGTIPKTGNLRETLDLMGSRFDYQLKTASRDNPLDVFGRTRGLYIPGVGVVFTTEVELAQSRIFGMFQTTVSPKDKNDMRERKLKNVDLLREQLRNVMPVLAKNLDFLPPGEHLVVAVRLLYQSWEDRAGLPDQMLIQTDRNSAAAGNVKVDIQ